MLYALYYIAIAIFVGTILIAWSVYRTGAKENELIFLRDEVVKLKSEVDSLMNVRYHEYYRHDENNKDKRNSDTKTHNT